MFGYIRPLKDELKVREFEQFKACYCGLCQTLKKEYGRLASFLLTYDFTFLAMLSWDGETAPETDCIRCAASPVRKKSVCKVSPVLSRCAGYSVILSRWKLKDTVEDESFFRSLKDRLLLLVYRRAYKKAARLYPEFEEAVRTNLTALRLSESETAPSLDACADKFARITAALAADVSVPEKKRPLEQVLYHTGRFIYILDAYDDLEADVEAGRFNPLIARFSPAGGRLNSEDRDTLKNTLVHSCRVIGAAYELLPENAWTGITRNIVYLGMAEAMNRVFRGIDAGGNGYKLKARTKGNGHNL
jgi:hypothetical protein